MQERGLAAYLAELIGTLLLAGGAVYSAYLFLRKQILPNRVLGNVFIALGGLLPAAGGALIKLAETGLGCLSIPDLFHLIHDGTGSV